MRDQNQPRLCQECGRNPSEIHVLGGSSTDLAVDPGAMEPKHYCRACFVEAFGDQTAFTQLVAAEAGSDESREESQMQLSVEAMRLISDAIHLAVQTGRPMFSETHLLAAILRDPHALSVMREQGLREPVLETLRGQLDPLISLPSVDLTPVSARPSPMFSKLMFLAHRIASHQQRRLVGVEDLVFALITLPDSNTSQTLRSAGLSVKLSSDGPPRFGTSDPTPALDSYSRDLTAEAAAGSLDMVVGRDEEIESVIEILARRRKNNVALIGEPGVGKTALAEGLALKIVADEVPESLRGRRLVSLDTGALIAGASMRGEFEARLKSVLEEVSASGGGIILFLDEMHSLLGTAGPAGGGSEGQVAAASMLKPMLARGELQMIGATTLAEYRRVEKDAAMARRFSTVQVPEPSIEETVQILAGLRAAYEAHHGVVISDGALEAAARLSDRYISDQFLPDKAIDLVDQAAARARLIRLASESPDREEELRRLEREKEAAVADERYDVAEQLKQRLEELRSASSQGADIVAGEEESVAVREPEIADVISRRTGIPIGELIESEVERIRELESVIRSRVIGQSEAVDAVVDAVKRSRVGLADSDRPTGSFLFLGPTGVGKTELAKALAVGLFSSEKALVRLDMSEYSERHTGSRLVGAPPGYVGHGEGGQLTEVVRRHPYSVVLLDEIEKAHPEVWNTLLQVLDDGRLTDGEGRTVDFRNTIIIMTSNAGAREAKKGPIGFGGGAEGARSGESRQSAERRERTVEAVRKVFAPEFFNRVDETIVFSPLGESDVEQITEILCERLSQKLQTERGVTLSVSEELRAQLARDGFDAQLGARPLQRHIRRALEAKLTDALLDGELKDGGSVRAELGEDGSARLEISPPQKRERLDQPAAGSSAASASEGS